MKPLLSLLAVAALAVDSARADLVLQQQIATPNYTGVTTLKIKGAKIRMDMFAGESNAWSNIADLNTGDTITLVHGPKMFLKTRGKPARPAKSSGTASGTLVPHPTGQTQKVGNYDTQLYTWSNPRGITGTAWVAPDYPDYQRIRADIATLDRTTSPDNDTSPELSTLPGMVIRSQVSGGGQTITLALISAKEGPLDSSLFTIPRDYKELPKTKPLIPAAAQPPPAQKTSGGSIPATPAAGAPAKTTTPPSRNLPAW